MGKTWVSARLSEEAMDVIRSVVSRNNLVDRTDAIEFIMREYWRLANQPFRRLFHLNAEKVKPLETFASAE